MCRNTREIRFHWKTLVSKCNLLDNKGSHERSSPACWPVEPLPTQVIILSSRHFNSVWNELRRGTDLFLTAQQPPSGCNITTPLRDTSPLSIPWNARVSMLKNTGSLRSECIWCLIITYRENTFTVIPCHLMLTYVIDVNLEIYKPKNLFSQLREKPDSVQLRTSHSIWGLCFYILWMICCV
jgi:hypothetical protein